MAINKTINKRTNSHGAMRNCIEYVLRQDKTSELLTYVTGPYCHDEINYDLVYRRGYCRSNKEICCQFPGNCYP